MLLIFKGSIVVKIMGIYLWSKNEAGFFTFHYFFFYYGTPVNVEQKGHQNIAYIWLLSYDTVIF